MNVKPACDRIKYDDTDVMLMKEALLVASRAEISAESKDFPSVGCVIRRSGHPFLRELYSIGWNGFLLKTSESDLASIKPNGGGPFKSLIHRGRVLARKLGLHAEEKALHACGEQNLSDATVYLTHVPCHDCAKRLLERNIRRVFYLFWMDKSNDTIELFKNHEIGKTCVAFPRRDLILDDFRSDFLTKYSITSGSTEPEKPPMECPSFVHPRDYKRE